MSEAKLDKTKVCVSIARGRHQQVVSEHRHLVEDGIDLVELRLDYVSGDVDLKRLLADRPCPVIATCRREEDGGRWSGSEQERQMLLRSAIVDGADYVDLEEDIADQIPRFGPTKRIVSMHDFSHTPDDLAERHARMAAKDADIVKIATMANSPHDNVRMLRLVRDASVPTVGICMGEIGMPTRILAPKYGVPFTFATFHSDRSLAPGQLSYRHLIDTYRFREINADTEVYGVIADPVGHSLSPLIHNAAFKAENLNKVYVPFRVPREHLMQLLDDCRELDIRGLSVTIPHKETVIKKLTRVDGAVQGIGACNTLIFDESGVCGFNTDYRAAMDALDQYLDTSQEMPLAGRTALLLGAGGVSKAFGFGLKRRGAKVVVSGILEDQGKELAKRLGGAFVPWDSRHSVNPDVLLNGTPLGMHPNIDETPFAKHHLRPSTIVFDAVYNPERTLLVKEAREQSCKVVTGVEMFVRQAALQFKHFTGLAAPSDLMHQEIKRAIGAAKY